ncbi:HNH endonuclease [Nocardia cyriacigeorgica]|uniref:HNH endonuclease n=1 Tax=Nocardia cyriacigeorgica TaxID=135487 RepID=UPI001895C5F1|nr:HNH endonuclease signature motif containing protein [Nocardia cyriacigeorgica]MBF6085286.1 HNH endonuclease [Nocardia cyriacigeorgica]
MAWGGRRAQALVRLTLDTYGTRCHLCERPPAATTADHLVPRSRGGDDSISNLRPAHQRCNAMRQDMPLDEWFRKHPIRRPALAPSRKW